MAQVAQGPGWSGGSLPVRAHDLLLSFAGQVDDDALADARELLAAAEVDRTLDFLVGCLVAGHIPISAAQRGELDALSAPAYLDRSLFNRLIVDDSAAIPRHRFAAEVPGTESAAQGVTDAAHRVLDALPDVRSVWAVWRLTPAGAVSGPVPHRVVLVGVGPAGFPTATAYRLEHTLRRVGVRASVEALRDGAQAPDYHHTAMQYATQVPFGAHAAIAPARPAAQLSASRLPAVPPGPAPRPGPPTATRMPAVNPPSMPRLEQPSGPRLPAPVNPPSVPRLEPPSRSRMPVAGPPSVPRLEPPSLSRTPPAPPPNRIPPGPPSMSRMPPAPPPNRMPPGPPSMSRMPSAGSPSVPRLEPPSLSGTAPAPPPSMSRMPPAPPPNRMPPGPPSMSRMPPAPPRGYPNVPADPLASAGAPRPPAPPRRPEPYPSRAAGTASGLPPLPPDAALSDQEKYLLRQLQEELVRREREEGNTSRLPGGPADPRWSNGAGPTMVNGIPPQYPDYR